MRPFRLTRPRAGERRNERSAGATSDVLVTGAAGLIGGILRAGLGNAYAVRGLDRVRGDDVDVVADLRKPGQLRRAFAGVRAVVDLAGDARADAAWEVVLNNNIAATIGVLEAAREAGVQRVVLASSNHVVGMYEQDEPYASVLAGRYAGFDPATLPRLRSDVPVRPDGPYGVGKAVAEFAGRYFAEAHGLSVICLRIGTVMGRDRPTRLRHFATLISHRDLVQLVRCCLEAPPSLRYAVLYGVSANTWRIWDLDEARATVGYEPVDDAEQWRDVEAVT